MKESLKSLSAQFLAQRHMLMAYIYGFLKDPSLTEDILQEVWIRMAEASESGVEIHNPLAWSRGVAKNLIREYWRKQQNTRVVFDEQLLDLADLAFKEQDTEVWHSRRLALEECIRALPRESKDVLRLTDLAGLPSSQVAQRLKRTSGSILMILHRLRRALAECVEKKLMLGAR
jgi:RNA polymerase sigma-70 factor, ECF subfamily